MKSDRNNSLLRNLFNVTYAEKRVILLRLHVVKMPPQGHYGRDCQKPQITEYEHQKQLTLGERVENDTEKVVWAVHFGCHQECQVQVAHFGRACISPKRSYKFDAAYFQPMGNLEDSMNDFDDPSKQEAPAPQPAEKSGHVYCFVLCLFYPNLIAGKGCWKARR